MSTAQSSRKRAGDDHVLTFPDGSHSRGDHLLVATPRRPTSDIGLETVGIEAGPRGIPGGDHPGVTGQSPGSDASLSTPS